jgi:hypothetical protein
MLGLGGGVGLKAYCDVDPWWCHGLRLCRRRLLLRSVISNGASSAEPAACHIPMTTLTNASPPAGRSPTKSTSESDVPLASKSMPWETDATHGKYQYYPGGDSSAAPKDAPSAINTVVVPDVELPKVRAFALCGLLPLWLGKLTHHCRDSTTSITSGARTATRHDSHLETAAYTEKEWSCLALLSMWAGVSCKLDRLRVTLRVEGDLNRACMNF